jgi:branched-chain amino acid aminotransferase
MALQKTEKIWHNGEFVDWDDANLHVLSHVIHYGSSVFEGIRCYRTPGGGAIFRLQDHVRRLLNSARIYRMEMPYSQEALAAATLETMRTNGLEEGYIRPLILRGYGSMGVNPLPCPVECYIAVWPWGAYLGAEALEDGVDTMVSTWTRIAPNTLPTLAKAGANYMNSQLIKMEAISNGFAEGIALDVDGFVSEGSGENLFLVQDGVLITPPLSSSILPGITRDSVMRLARDAGLEVVEERVPRESLYTADEAFFTGTAAEITPIRSVDRLPVGSGHRGAITARLQETYFRVIRGECEDPYGWLTPLQAVESQVAG